MKEDCRKTGGKEEVSPFRMIDDKAIWLVNGLKLCHGQGRGVEKVLSQQCIKERHDDKS